MPPTLDRRSFLAAGLAAVAAAPVSAQKDPPPARGKPTKFQIACMTLPYSQFPLERALSGIKEAGYRHVAWGTTHREDGGKSVPVMAPGEGIGEALPRPGPGALDDVLDDLPRERQGH
jgi:hypothetical protein